MGEDNRTKIKVAHITGIYALVGVVLAAFLAIYLNDSTSESSLLRSEVKDITNEDSRLVKLDSVIDLDEVNESDPSFHSDKIVLPVASTKKITGYAFLGQVQVKNYGLSINNQEADVLMHSGRYNGIIDSSTEILRFHLRIGDEDYLFEYRYNGENEINIDL